MANLTTEFLTTSALHSAELSEWWPLSFNHGISSLANKPHDVSNLTRNNQSCWRPNAKHSSHLWIFHDQPLNGTVLLAATDDFKVNPLVLRIWTIAQQCPKYHANICKCYCLRHILLHPAASLGWSHTSASCRTFAALESPGLRLSPGLVAVWQGPRGYRSFETHGICKASWNALRTVSSGKSMGSQGLQDPMRILLTYSNIWASQDAFRVQGVLRGLHHPSMRKGHSWSDMNIARKCKKLEHSCES